MNALTARIAEDYARAAPPHDSATAERRRAALGALTRAGLPTSRDENWKYANLRALERLRFAPPAALPGAHSLAGLPAPIADFSRYVFVDGCFAPQLSSASRAAFADLASAPPQARDGARTQRGSGAALRAAERRLRHRRRAAAHRSPARRSGSN